MIYLDIILKSLGIAAIITFMIILIWGFVVFNSIYGQLKYTNYILEKISHILNIETREDFAKRKAVSAAIREENTEEAAGEDTTKNIDEE